MDGSLASNLCLALYPTTSDAYSGPTVGTTVITSQTSNTTTTTYRGASTKSKPLATTSATSTTYTVSVGALYCLSYPSGSIAGTALALLQPGTVVTTSPAGAVVTSS